MINRWLYKSIYIPSHLVKLGVKNARGYRGLCTSAVTPLVYKKDDCTPSAVKNFQPVYQWLRTGDSKVSINEENSFPVMCAGLFIPFLPKMMLKFETIVPYEVAQELQLTSHVTYFKDRLELRLYWTIPCSTLKLNPARFEDFSGVSFQNEYIVRQNDGAKRMSIFSERFSFDGEPKGVMVLKCVKRHTFQCSTPFNLKERTEFTGGPIKCEVIDISELGLFLLVDDINKDPYNYALTDFEKESYELSVTFKHSVLMCIRTLAWITRQLNIQLPSPSIYRKMSEGESWKGEIDESLVLSALEERFEKHFEKHLEREDEKKK